MGKYIFLILLLIFFSGSSLEAEEFSFKSATIEGPTGLIRVPSTEIIDKKLLGLHYYHYNFKLTYNFLSFSEIGMRVQLDEINEVTRRSLHQVQPYGKAILLNRLSFPVCLALGLSLYDSSLITQYFPPVDFLRNYSLVGAVNFNRKKISTKIQGGLTKKMGQTLLVLDWDGENWGLGPRVLISPQLKFDFFIEHWRNISEITLDNVVVGITYTG